MDDISTEPMSVPGLSPEEAHRALETMRTVTAGYPDTDGYLYVAIDGTEWIIFRNGNILPHNTRISVDTIEPLPFTEPFSNRGIDDDIDMNALQALFDAEDIETTPITETVEEEEVGVFAIFKNYENNFQEGVKELLKFYYPEELYDIIPFEMNEDNNKKLPAMKIILHFPEVTVNNKRGESHIMRDFFVKFDIVFYSDNLFTLSNIRGRRLKLTAQEIQADYQFSHLSGGINQNWNNFCFGDSTPITILFNKISRKHNKNTLEDVYKFFLLLDTYVTWESLEGVPYRKIGHIGTSNVSSSGEQREVIFKLPFQPFEFDSNGQGITLDLVTSLWEHIIDIREYFTEFCTKCIQKKPLSETGEFELHFNNLMELLKRICIEFSDIGFYFNDLYYFDEDRYLFIKMASYDSVLSKLGYIENSSIVFKGKTIKFQLENYDKKSSKYSDMSIKTPNVYLNPGYAYSVYKKFLNKFNYLIMEHYK